MTEDPTLQDVLQTVLKGFQDMQDSLAGPDGELTRMNLRLDRMDQRLDRIEKIVDHWPPPSQIRELLERVGKLEEWQRSTKDLPRLKTA